jgi:hypothetical protein
LPPASSPESGDEGDGPIDKIRTGAVIVIVLLVGAGAAVAVGLAVFGGVWLRRRRQ